jgi:hypothetical protein
VLLGAAARGILPDLHGRAPDGSPLLLPPWLSPALRFTAGQSKALRRARTAWEQHFKGALTTSLWRLAPHISLALSVEVGSNPHEAVVCVAAC